MASLVILMHSSVQLLAQQQGVTAAKDDKAVSRKQLQALSVLLCQLVMLGVEVLIPSQWADQTAAGRINAQQVGELHVIPLTAVALLPLALYGPSIYYVLPSRRRVVRRPHSSVVGGVHLFFSSKPTTSTTGSGG